MPWRRDYRGPDFVIIGSPIEHLNEPLKDTSMFKTVIDYLVALLTSFTASRTTVDQAVAHLQNVTSILETVRDKAHAKADALVLQAEEILTQVEAHTAEGDRAHRVAASIGALLK